MVKSELLVGGRRNFYSSLANFTRLIGRNFKSSALGIYNDERIPTVGCVNGQCPNTFNFQMCVESIGEGWHIFYGNSLCFAVTTLCGDIDETTRSLKNEPGFRFMHRYYSGLQQHG